MARWHQHSRGSSRDELPLRARLAILFFCGAALLVTSAWAVDFLLRDTIKAWAEGKAVNMATRAISLAVTERLSEQIHSRDLVTPVTDASGRVLGFQYAMGEINRLEAQAATGIQDYLHMLAEERLPVPLGLLTGMDWLAALGPSVSIRFIPSGRVRTTPKSDFQAAGINQVLHRIYVDVEVKMRVIAPLLDTYFPVRQQIVLTERVIVGEVPQFFVQWGSGDLHNLPGGSLLAPLHRN